MEQEQVNTLIQRTQMVLDQLEGQLAQVREYEKQLETQVAAQRGALSVLMQMAEDEELQREFLPHLFKDKDANKDELVGVAVAHNGHKK